MSLALFRERIEAGDVDETVRAHLRGCDECRAHFDLLARTARALGDDGAAAERQRLLAALPAAAPKRSVPWLAAIAALLLAFVALFLLRRAPVDDVTMRGGAEGSAAPFSLRVYGKDSPGEKVRLIADFPGAKEATVGMRAELQYFVKPPPKAGQVLLVESRSGVKTLSARSQKGDDVVPVGAAFPVGAFGPGSIDVCAALTGPDVETLEAAVKAGATKYCATLVVTP